MICFINTRRGFARTRAALFLTALATAGCGGDAPRSGGGTFITGPAPMGSIRVSTVTTGGDVDLNGYRLFVDNGVRPFVLAPSATGPTATATSGKHTVALGDVAANCSVRGQHPREVTVSVDATTEVLFEVDCVATGVKVFTRTTGPDPRTRFEATIAGGPGGWVGANDSVVIGRLNRGAYFVSLGNLESQCRVIGEKTVPVNVPERTVTPVIFNVVCGDPPAKAYVDGRIVFVSYDQDTAGSLIIADSTGSRALKVETSGPANGPSWGPTGDKIVFSSVRCDYYYCFGDLMLADLKANTVKTLAEGRLGADPDWGADDVIAFTTLEPFAQGLNKIRLITGDGSFLADITMKGIRAARNPSWSPDGTRIAFECSFPQQGRSQEICIVSRDGSTLTELTNSVTSDLDPAWSPDGSMIAFTTLRFGQQPSVAVIAIDGTAVVRLAEGTNPAWSRDGKKITFEARHGLFTVDRDGGNLTPLTAGRHGEPAWRP